ncbi:hypothetical protein SAMN02927937_02385 [Paenimyroides aquimaris]|uniref:YD repeat-containing protein n=1 Tax=Paenimyroides marinum TaxID=1159016 RepID=A0A1H6M3L6_9FLAO|nr:hypothetical protein [Paenimyroides aquimaris]SEH95820.1 hypothetical protein SAMN02927937_02385 [Paenimyroides aquimaris]
MKITVHNTIQKICILFLAVFALASCTKDDDTNPDGNGSGYLLLVTEFKNNGVTVGRYEFDDKNRMTAFHSYDGEGAHAVSATYTYDERNRLLLVTNKLVDGTLVSTIEHVYEGNDDKPVSAVTTNYAGAVVVWNITYSYANNQLTETIIQSAPAPEIINVYTYNANGDLTSLKTNLGGIWAGTTEYGDYDDKNSPSMLGNPFDWKIPYRHNFRSFKTTQESGVTEDQFYKYTYNDSGYPVKAEVYDRATNELVETHEYTYKKAN